MIEKNRKKNNGEYQIELWGESRFVYYLPSSLIVIKIKLKKKIKQNKTNLHVRILESLTLDIRHNLIRPRFPNQAQFISNTNNSWMDLIMSKFDKTKIKAGAHFLISITNILAQYCKSIAKSCCQTWQKTESLQLSALVGPLRPKNRGYGYT